MTVVYANPFVGVLDGDVERKVVVESVIVEIELGQGGIGDGEFGLLGKEDQPEYEKG